MPTARIPLAYNIESRKADLSKDAKIVNGMVESRDGETEIVKRPGLVEYANVGSTGQAQGLYSWKGSNNAKYILAAKSNTLYKIDGSKTVTALTGSDIVGSEFPFSFSSSANYVAAQSTVTIAQSLFAVTFDAAPTTGGVIVTQTAHGYVAGDQVTFSSVGGYLPIGITEGTSYYILSAGLGTNTYSISTTLEGTAIDITADGVGTFYARPTTTTEGIITYNHHTFVANTSIKFSLTGTTSSLPVEIVEGTIYYVVAPITTNTFNIASTPNGTPITTVSPSVNGDGTVVCTVGSYLGFHNESNIYTVDTVSDTIYCADSGDKVLSATITIPGGFYSVAPGITISPPSVGTQATAITTISNHQVSDITITNQGSGYTTVPIITIDPPPSGTQATTLQYETGSQGSIQSMVTQGSGYVIAPSVYWTYAPPPGYVVSRKSYAGYSVINSSGNVIYWVFTTNPNGPWQVGIIVDPPPNQTAEASANMNSTISGPYAPGMVYLDGATYVLKKDNARIYGSDLENPNSWNALNFITAGSDLDPGVGIARHLNYIVAFGKWSTEFFYDAGTAYPASPLAPNQGAKLEIGCANGYSIAKIEQSLIWVGNSLTNGKSVYILSGLTPIKISTKYMDKYLNKADMISPFSVRSYAFKVAGHTLYVLILEDLGTFGTTFIYDVDEQRWYQWTKNTGTVDPNKEENYFSLTSYTGNTEYAPGVYLQDDHNGKIYIMSTEYNDDAGDAIYFRARSPIIDSGTTKRKFYRRIEVVGDKVSASLSIRHSDDDYTTWSNYRTVNLQDTRPILYQNGTARRRAWEIFSSDNQPIRLRALELDFDIGEQGVGQEG